MRVGPTVFEPGRRRDGSKWLFIIFLIVSPVVLYFMQYNFSQLLAQVDEVKGEVVEVRSPADVPHFGRQIVHTSGAVDPQTSSMDPHFNVEVPAISLKRNCEYCQWVEHTNRDCETCTDRDGNSYDCNCVTTYYYVKQWVSFRINSLLFQQPAAHWNPQRDPFPSSTYVSRNSGVSGFKLDPPILENLKATWDYIDWTPTGYREPGWFDFITQPMKNFFGIRSPNYRHFHELENTVNSEAAQEHKFVYVGNGGYFLSRYESSAQAQAFKWAMQAVEGTLLDWQVGDLFGCTPGDIRVYYSAAMPPDVSVIGQATTAYVPQIKKIPTQNGASSFGMVHDGVSSPSDMFEREVSDSKFYLKAFQVFFFGWAGSIAWLCKLGESDSLRILSAIGVWGVVVFSFKGLTLWQHSMDVGYSWMFVVACAGLLALSTTYKQSTINNQPRPEAHAMSRKNK